MIRNRITLKIVRSFSIGFTIYSPKYNGWLSIEVNIACFTLFFDAKGVRFFGVENYWNE
jgi:hypothetical protein